MHLARSAVSRRIGELEKHLGANLILRTTRQLSVTETGSTFYERASQLLGEFEDLESQTALGHQGFKGMIRLAAPLSFTLRQLQPTLEAFRKRYPEITFELHLGDRRVDIVGEGFDFALRIGSTIESSMIAQRLCVIRHLVAASPEYLARRGTPRTPDDLALHAALCYTNVPKSGSWSYWDEIDPGAREVRLNPALLCDNGDVLLDTALRGGGIICEPTFLSSEAIAQGRLVPVLTEWTWSKMHAYLVYPPHRRIPARVRALMDTLSKSITDPPPWDRLVDEQLPQRKAR